MIDKLNKPLSGKRGKSGPKDRKTSGARIPLVPVALTVLALVVGTPVAWVTLIDNPDGGRPIADVEVNSVVDSNELAKNLSIDTPDDATPPGEVEILNPASPSDPLVVSTDGLPDDDSESDDGGARADMLEQSQHGPIPQISVNGERPSKIYARPSISRQSAGGKPLIAVIVTGVGLSFDASASAIDRLPDDFTLAMAPYGKKVNEVAKRARLGGHETLLQVPMEPFDYPQNDPGPHTLLVGQSARSNLDHLYWLLSRGEAYTGIINHLGAKFTSSSNDFEPVMEELSLRGLSYVDDGSSNRSIARQLAQRVGAPYAIANMTVDVTPSRSAILEHLGKLEQIARDKGSAIGIAAMLPVSVRTLTEWAATLEDKNIQLVPVSALYISQGGL